MDNPPLSETEENSDDEWYKAMESAAIGDDSNDLEIEEIVHLQGSSGEILSEDEYFENILQSACALPSMFAPEEDKVWELVFKD